METYGRTVRFAVGDAVSVTRINWAPSAIVKAIHCDPVNVKGFEHCLGKSARYDLLLPSGEILVAYDWQLAKADPLPNPTK